jgi:CRP-like cAMP-binding protein
MDLSNFNIKWKEENEKSKFTRVKVAILGVGEIFGEEEIFSNGKRITAARCVSTRSEVMSISKEVK